MQQKIKAERIKGDPSDIVQLFPKFEINILCCRYWWMQSWEIQDLSYPFWRIYHNNCDGATITYEGKEISLSPDKIILIPPYTSYSSRLYNKEIPNDGYSLIGGRVQENPQKALNNILHLFIHFNLSQSYNFTQQDIYTIPINNELERLLSDLKEHLTVNVSEFNFYSTIAINALISHLISTLPANKWKTVCNDQRILETISHIERRITMNLDNSSLARRINMSTNSFIRLFKQETKTAPQKYVKQVRINKACILLHHSSMSIDEIANKCGFADRYHFSRIFKQITGHPPAKYRQEQTLSNL